MLPVACALEVPLPWIAGCNCGRSNCVRQLLAGTSLMRAATGPTHRFLQTPPPPLPQIPGYRAEPIRYCRPRSGIQIVDVSKGY